MQVNSIKKKVEILEIFCLFVPRTFTAEFHDSLPIARQASGKAAEGTPA